MPMSSQQKSTSCELKQAMHQLKQPLEQAIVAHVATFANESTGNLGNTIEDDVDGGHEHLVYAKAREKVSGQVDDTSQQSC